MNQIFYVALIVMFIGFGFILWAVRQSIGQPSITPTSEVAAAAGIISQFIGATFMLIYNVPGPTTPARVSKKKVAAAGA